MTTSVLPSLTDIFVNDLFKSPSASAGGLLSYLDETDTKLKIKALQKLFSIIDVHWAEIINSITTIEELSEDESFPASDLASAIASKCYYHLQEYEDSLRFALSSGQYFDISKKNEYIDTLLAVCIDEYKKKRLESLPIDIRIENILEQMFQRCYRDSCYEQAMGIALDTRRLDKVEEVIEKALNVTDSRHSKESILTYTYDLCQGARNISSREFRLEVMNILTQSYMKLAEPDYSNMCLGLQYLNRPMEVAETLYHLISQSSIEQVLMAYQIAFQLLETENQGFVLKVWSHFEGMSNIASASANSAVVTVNDVLTEDFNKRISKLKQILIDGLDVDLILNFLFKYSKADVSVLQTIKTLTDNKSLILHNAVVVTHAYMNAGTTRDTFLRNNLEWLGKASNWAKFTAVGSFGVVHKGHVHESLTLLQPYLPQANGVSASGPYSEAGALYALGLIHANKGGGNGHSPTISYLIDALRNSGTNEVVQHGGSLGVGLAAMATGDIELYNILHAILMSDSAVAGEGAALGIGLLMIGQSESALAQENFSSLLNYAHDTSHEKIIRALGLAIAMMVYSKEESADVIIEQLSRDRDPILRYGGMYAIGLAYCGTGDNQAIKKLLHVAVSDVNDDVRRAAVTVLGFVNFRQPETVPKLVSLLAESFNPHVRYGACLAIGIACVGTSLKSALEILTPMLEDAIDYVRQGALIAMALVLQQVSEARSPSVKKFRDQLLVILNDKHQTHLTKSGAILAMGILDIGGKNVMVSLSSRSGFMKMGGAVGMMMFLQYWYWYPLQLFLSLSFNSTIIIGLNKDFDMPKDFSLTCNAPLSMFDYNKSEEKKSDEKKHVATAVLSTTVKAKAREARKEAHKKTKLGSPSGDSMHDTIPLDRTTSHLSTVSYLSIDEQGVKSSAPEPEVITKKEKEPTSFLVTNPSRLLPSQLKFISLTPSSSSHDSSEGDQSFQRYSPVYKRATPVGIVMLIDNDPSKPEDVAKVERVSLNFEEEADAPEPFTWDPNDP